MATWDELTKEQKVELLMSAGSTRIQAGRYVAIFDGELDPNDVVGGLPPPKPLGT